MECTFRCDSIKISSLPVVDPSTPQKPYIFWPAFSFFVKQDEDKGYDEQINNSVDGHRTRGYVSGRESPHHTSMTVAEFQRVTISFSCWNLFKKRQQLLRNGKIELKRTSRPEKHVKITTSSVDWVYDMRPMPLLSWILVLQVCIRL